ncbi:MAG: hypothetical protein ACK5MN_07165 [Lachnospiraceae bacterium]
MTDITNEGAERLVQAIIMQAVNDYKTALKTLIRFNDIKGSNEIDKVRAAKRTKEEVERFFYSDWYRELTNVSGDKIIQKVREDVKEWCKQEKMKKEKAIQQPQRNI